MKMKVGKISGNLALLMAIVLCMGGFHGAFAWFGGAPFMGISYPHLVQFTGTFYPADKKIERAGLGTLTVLVPQKKWTFQVQKIRDVSGDSTPFGILNSIFPPILYLRGSASVMSSLEKPGIAGEPVILRGYLYRGHRILQVTEIEKVTQEAK